MNCVEEKVRPAEAARRVMEDIRAAPKKLAMLDGVKITENNFYVGNQSLHMVYGTVLSGAAFELYESLNSRVLRPLGLGLVVAELEDIPCDAVMIEHVGRLVKEYRDGQRGHVMTGLS